MKLTLAIAVCIGFYLCAVSAETLNKKGIDDSEFAKMIKIFGYLKKSSMFPKTLEEYKNLVNLYRQYQQLLDDPEKYRDSSHKDPVTFRGSRDKHRQYQQQILETVEDAYVEFVRKALDGVYLSHLGNHYYIVKGSYKELYKADYNFQINCILAYEKKKSPNRKLSSSLGSREFAYDALVEQLNVFIEELMNSGIGDDAKGELKEISKENNFLKFFGFWFEPNCSPVAMGNAIEEMKKVDRGLEDKDEAAKVMVLLKKFKGGKEDKNYPATPQPTLKSTFSRLLTKKARD